MLARSLDVLVDSAVWVALAAAALTAAAGLALGVGVAPALAALAFCGTLLVYVVDRVRDVESDAVTSPVRTAFVSRNRRALAGLAGMAGVAGIALATQVPPRALVPPLLALPLAFLHRRLKGVPLVKPFYVTGAWIAVVVGMPAALPGAHDVGWVAAVVGLSILANAMASNVRDREAGAARYGERRVLLAARVVAGVAAAVAVAAPAAVRPLVAVALLTLAALLGFRSGERYGLVVVDGALLVGALAALGLGSALG